MPGKGNIEQNGKEREKKELRAEDFEIIDKQKLAAEQQKDAEKEREKVSVPPNVDSVDMSNREAVYDRLERFLREDPNDTFGFRDSMRSGDVGFEEMLKAGAIAGSDGKRINGVDGRTAKERAQKIGKMLTKGKPIYIYAKGEVLPRKVILDKKTGELKFSTAPVNASENSISSAYRNLADRKRIMRRSRNDASFVRANGPAINKSAQDAYESFVVTLKNDLGFDRRLSTTGNVNGVEALLSENRILDSDGNPLGTTANGTANEQAEKIGKYLFKTKKPLFIFKEGEDYPYEVYVDKRGRLRASELSIEKMNNDPETEGLSKAAKKNAKYRSVIVERLKPEIERRNAEKAQREKELKEANEKEEKAVKEKEELEKKAQEEKETAEKKEAGSEIEQLRKEILEMRKENLELSRQILEMRKEFAGGAKISEPEKTAEEPQKQPEPEPAELTKIKQAKALTLEMKPEDGAKRISAEFDRKSGDFVSFDAAGMSAKEELAAREKLRSGKDELSEEDAKRIFSMTEEQALRDNAERNIVCKEAASLSAKSAEKSDFELDGRTGEYIRIDLSGLSVREQALKRLRVQTGGNIPKNALEAVRTRDEKTLEKDISERAARCREEAARAERIKSRAPGYEYDKKQGKMVSFERKGMSPADEMAKRMKLRYGIDVLPENVVALISRTPASNLEKENEGRNGFCEGSFKFSGKGGGAVEYDALSGEYVHFDNSEMSPLDESIERMKLRRGVVELEPDVIARLVKPNEEIKKDNAARQALCVENAKKREEARENAVGVEFDKKSGKFVEFSRAGMLPAAEAMYRMRLRTGEEVLAAEAASAVISASAAVLKAENDLRNKLCKDARRLSEDKNAAVEFDAKSGEYFHFDKTDMTPLDEALFRLRMRKGVSELSGADVASATKQNTEIIAENERRQNECASLAEKAAEERANLVGTEYDRQRGGFFTFDRNSMSPREEAVYRMKLQKGVETLEREDYEDIYSKTDAQLEAENSRRNRICRQADELHGKPETGLAIDTKTGEVFAFERRGLSLFDEAVLREELTTGNTPVSESRKREIADTLPEDLAAQNEEAQKKAAPISEKQTELEEARKHAEKGESTEFSKKAGAFVRFDSSAMTPEQEAQERLKMRLGVEELSKEQLQSVMSLPQSVIVESNRERNRMCFEAERLVSAQGDDIGVEVDSVSGGVYRFRRGGMSERAEAAERMKIREGFGVIPQKNAKEFESLTDAELESINKQSRESIKNDGSVLPGSPVKLEIIELPAVSSEMLVTNHSSSASYFREVVFDKKKCLEFDPRKNDFVVFDSSSLTPAEEFRERLRIASGGVLPKNFRDFSNVSEKSLIEDNKRRQEDSKKLYMTVKRREFNDSIGVDVLRKQLDVEGEGEALERNEVTGKYVFFDNSNMTPLEEKICRMKIRNDGAEISEKLIEQLGKLSPEELRAENKAYQEMRVSRYNTDVERLHPNMLYNEVQAKKKQPERQPEVRNNEEAHNAPAKRAPVKRAPVKKAPEENVQDGKNYLDGVDPEKLTEPELLIYKIQKLNPYKAVPETTKDNIFKFYNEAKKARNDLGEKCRNVPKSGKIETKVGGCDDVKKMIAYDFVKKEIEMFDRLGVADNAALAMMASPRCSEYIGALINGTEIGKHERRRMSKDYYEKNFLSDDGFAKRSEAYEEQLDTALTRLENSMGGSEKCSIAIKKESARELKRLDEQKKLDEKLEAKRAEERSKSQEFGVPAGTI